MFYTIWDFVQKVFKDSGKIWATPAPAFLTQFYALKSDQMLLFCIATWMPLKSTVDPLLAGFVVRSNSGWSFGINFCNDCRNANSSFHFEFSASWNSIQLLKLKKIQKYFFARLQDFLLKSALVRNKLAKNLT